jgi:hypothetical protein
VRLAPSVIAGASVIVGGDAQGFADSAAGGPFRAGRGVGASEVVAESGDRLAGDLDRLVVGVAVVGVGEAVVGDVDPGGASFSAKV